MSLTRQCSRSTCVNAAVATLTYVYADSTVVVGPLATTAEPHSYDLCLDHADGLTAPRGWDVVRLAGDYVPAVPDGDDLLALADAVREAGARPLSAENAPALLPEPTLARAAVASSGARPDLRAPAAGARRGHLRVVSDDRQ